LLHTLNDIGVAALLLPHYARAMSLYLCSILAM
jgi:hypothetical protein